MQGQDYCDSQRFHSPGDFDCEEINISGSYAAEQPEDYCGLSSNFGSDGYSPAGSECGDSYRGAYYRPTAYEECPPDRYDDFQPRTSARQGPLGDFEDCQATRYNDCEPIGYEDCESTGYENCEISGYTDEPTDEFPGGRQSKYCDCQPSDYYDAEPTGYEDCDVSFDDCLDETDYDSFFPQGMSTPLRGKGLQGRPDKMCGYNRFLPQAASSFRRGTGAYEELDCGDYTTTSNLSYGDECEPDYSCGDVHGKGDDWPSLNEFLDEYDDQCEGDAYTDQCEDDDYDDQCEIDDNGDQCEIDDNDDQCEIDDNDEPCSDDEEDEDDECEEFDDDDDDTEVFLNNARRFFNTI